jgi:heterodisulfide reductase subunit A2
MKYDALVIGAGIGGMESSLKLGDMGYKVLLVEKEASVGGRMILLSKVFPTLDCASCISGPKMSSTINHPNVTTMTYAEVESIRRNGDGSFQVRVHQKARYVDTAACTGCQECERACTVAVPDEFNYDLVGRRAAYIPFPQAVPKKAVITRAGTSPCTGTCPAGIKAHGYVSLTRSGKYEEAFQRVLDATPLVGTLGRACYAPCESECTRTKLEGAIPIRRIKRFVADRHYARADGPGIEVAEPTGKRVAVVGSGPAGLTAAWQLARRGHTVKVFEAAAEPGGALRLSIPSYRLPNDVVDRDIANVTAIGVEIATGARITNLAALRADGFDAVVVATGTPKSVRLGVPGEALDGIGPALDFLRLVKLGEPVNFAGREVVVIGGGNVAIDAARTARRLGAAAVHMVCLEQRAEMPAHAFEVDEALAEGVVLHNGWGIRGFRGDARVGAVELKRCTGVFDADGHFAPRYDDGETRDLACGAVIVAIGMSPDTEAFAAQVPVARNRRLQVDPRTLQSEVPYVFAAGDVATGPTDITRAVGQGRRAAYMADRWLRGLELGVFEGFDDRLGTIGHDEVLARQKAYGRREPLAVERRLAAAPSDFAEVEPALTEDEAIAGAGSCLDCGVCSECGECVAACPAFAIDLDMHARTHKVEVGAVVLSTGFKLFAADVKPEYGWGRFPNVITGTQMDRLLAPTRPFNTVLRPGDGKVPERIAYISCTGSRDRTVNNPLCSKFCCMYSVKQNQLIMGALPLADVTMHYMDMRAAGKRYEEFYQQARDMGATYIKGRVANITEKPDGNLIVHYEDIENGGTLREAEYDLVVLAVGIQPNRDVERLFVGEPLRLDEFAYVAEADDDLEPGRTSIGGVFVAGTAAGAKDIVDSITHAGAAVAQVAAHLQRTGYRRAPAMEVAS